MGGSYYILLINFALGVLLLFGFTALWLHDRKRVAVLCWLLAILGFLVGGTFELLAPRLGDGRASLFRLGIQMFNFGACMLLALGTLQHYAVRVRPAHAWMFLALGTAVIVAVLDMPRQSPLRMTLNQLPLALALAFAVWRAWGSSRMRSPLDRLFALSLGLFAANIMLRPALLVAFGTMGEDPASYHLTAYAAATQFSMAITSMTCATLGLMVIVGDTVRELSERSVCDPLTGLLNRRGLAERDASRPRGSHGRTAAVVVADIDHFKRVNDRFGHAAGDAVLVEFAGLLDVAAGQRDTVARLGGEEFVVVLADASPEMGKLYAEGVRTALANLALAAVDGERLTASFGVAALPPAMGLDDAIEAADVALYAAKRTGRNRVETAAVRCAAREPAAGDPAGSADAVGPNFVRSR